MPRARNAVAVVALLVVTTGCRGCAREPVRSYVDVPVTLDEVRARQAPPKTVAAVERITKTQGGGACGHSPACLIVVPILLYSSLFPSQYDLATITEDGTVVYSATFQTDGTFIQARARQDGTVRDLRLLNLPKLGQRVVVEVARAPVGPDGKEGAFVPTPVLGQVDLLADYRAALARTTGGRDRGALLSEALSWLGEESLPLVRERLEDAKEADEARASVTADVCKAWDGARATGARPTGIDVVLAAVRNAPGPATAAAALPCFGGEAPDLPGAKPFVSALARHVCAGKGGVCEAQKALAARPELHAAVDRDAVRCEPAPRRALLDLTLAQPVAADALAQALAVEDETNACLPDLLDARRPEHRRGVVRALTDERLANGGERAARQLALVRTLYAAEGAPSADDLRAVATVFPRQDTRLLSFDPSRDRERRTLSLALFHAAARKESLTRPAREVLHAALPTVAEKERPPLRAALVVLGERDEALSAARGLEIAEISKLHHIPKRPGDENASRLVAYGLHLSGCTDEEILALVREAPKIAADARGPACTR